MFLRPGGVARGAITTLAIVGSAAACSGSGSATAPPPPTAAHTTSTTTTSATAAGSRVVVHRSPATLPRGSARAVLVVDGSQLLLLGGLDATRNTTDEILRIDPSTGTVTRSGSLAVRVHDAAAATVAGRPTMFGGGNTSESAEVQAVAPDGGAHPIGRLPVPRSDLAAAVMGGRVFLVGGYDGSRVRATTLATSDGATFQVLGNLLVPVRYAAVAPHGSDILVIGGTTNGAADGAVRSVQALDTRTGSVRTVGDLPFAVTDAVAAELRGEVYVIGGLVGGTPSRYVWRLDLPSTPGPAQLVPVATLPVPLADAAIAIDHNVAFVAGGESPALASAVFTVEVR
jgi:hypothetical protein